MLPARLWNPQPDGEATTPWWWYRRLHLDEDALLTATTSNLRRRYGVPPDSFDSDDLDFDSEDLDQGGSDTDSAAASATPSTASTVRLTPEQLEQELSSEDEPEAPPVVPAVPLNPEPEPEPEPQYHLSRDPDDLRHYLQHFPQTRDPEVEQEVWAGNAWDLASDAQRRIYREATEHAWADECENAKLPISSLEQGFELRSRLTLGEYSDFRAEVLRRYTHYCTQVGCEPWAWD